MLLRWLARWLFTALSQGHGGCGHFNGWQQIVQGVRLSRARTASRHGKAKAVEPQQFGSCCVALHAFQPWAIVRSVQAEERAS